MSDPSSIKVYKYDANSKMSGSYYEHCVFPCVIDQEWLTYSGDGFLVKTSTSHQVDEEDPETDANY